MHVTPITFCDAKYFKVEDTEIIQVPTFHTKIYIHILHLDKYTSHDMAKMKYAEKFESATRGL